MINNYIRVSTSANRQAAAILTAILISFSEQNLYSNLGESLIKVIHASNLEEIG